MMLISHTIIGLAVARLLPYPAGVAVVAFLSHFAADLIPHWDFFCGTTNESGERLRGWRAIGMLFDLVLSLSLGWFFVWRAYWFLGDSSLAFNFLLGAAFANLPDALEAPYIYHLKQPWILERLTDFHRKLQAWTGLFWGLLIQGSLVAIGLVLLLS